MFLVLLKNNKIIFDFIFKLNLIMLDNIVVLIVRDVKYLLYF